MSQPETVYLIDGSSYIFRAYYAVQRLTTSQGFPTNALFGFINMLLKVVEDRKPRYVAVAFDTPKPSFRKALYPDYKANRDAPPEDLIPQFAPIHRAVEAMGLKSLSREGFEADDIIATLATRLSQQGHPVIIISGDKDLMQLVNDKVVLYDSMNDKRYDPAAVREKFQVGPEQIRDYLALMGDSSDNIPGVSGIGKKTAAELLAQFGSLEALYEKLDAVKSEKRRETLRQERDAAFLSRDLTTLKTDMDLGVGITDLEYQGPLRPQMEALLKEFEFSQLAKRLGLESSAPRMERARVVVLRDREALARALESLSRASLVAVDTETTSLHPQEADLVGVSLCGGPDVAYYLPLGHYVSDGQRRERAANQMEPAEAKKLLKPFLENPRIPKTGQNLKYDRQVLYRWGAELEGVTSDTLLASYLLEPDESHGLDALALRYLGHKNISYEEVTGKGKSQVSFAEVEISRAAEYAAEDAEVTLKLDHLLVPRLEPLGLGELYRSVELPLSRVLGDMEFSGVSVDRPRLENMGRELAGEIVALEARIHSLAGETFNINSPKQLGTILFEKLKLPVVKKTKTGISTDESVLEKLASSHAICREILSYRGLVKLRSTYVEGLLSQIHPTTQRIHTHYNQAGTATGRLSSSQPNLQNIPVPGETPYDIRSVFVPEKGRWFLSADYSQVELRLLADMSGDPELTRAFSAGEDVHEFTARSIFGVNTVTPEQRRVAKTINFGVVYGQTPYGLSQTLGIAQGEAKHFIDSYFARYSKVRAYLNSLVESARETGYASTRLGRRRRVGDINSKNRMLREMAERMAVNTPIQGTAADMIKVAMVRLYDRLRNRKFTSRMVLQVHDELVLEVPTSEKEEVERLVVAEMEGAMKLSIPLKVDTGWGSNWSECS